jgi:5-methylcytosine-specific restriction endonuclease McrA
VANREKYLECKRLYREANKAKIAAYGKAYKAAVKPVDEGLAMQLKETHACLRCRIRSNLEVHHIKHQRHGGRANDLNNLLVLCKPCHARWHKFFNVDYWSDAVMLQSNQLEAEGIPQVKVDPTLDSLAA